MSDERSETKVWLVVAGTYHEGERVDTVFDNKDAAIERASEIAAEELSRPNCTITRDEERSEDAYNKCVQVWHEDDDYRWVEVREFVVHTELPTE